MPGQKIWSLFHTNQGWPGNSHLLCRLIMVRWRFRFSFYILLLRHNSWAICEQPGYFIHGFFTVGPNFLSDIGKAQCCKPSSHPEENRGCRDVNVDFTVDGTKACPQGSFLKGFYKTTCSTINCLTQIRCCEMVPG